MSEEKSHDITATQLNQLLILSCSIVLGMCLVSAYAWLQLPDDIQIPVHWDIDGQADRYGGKAQGLLLMPGITLLTCLLFRVIPIFEPRRHNLLRSMTISNHLPECLHAVVWRARSNHRQPTGIF